MPSAQPDGNADGSLEEHSRLIRIVRSNNLAKTNAISSELFYKPLNGRILLSSHAWFSMVDWSLSWNTKITDSLPGTRAPQGETQRKLQSNFHTSRYTIPSALARSEMRTERPSSHTPQ